MRTASSLRCNTVQALSLLMLAGASHLRWRTGGDVERFIAGFGAVETRVIDDYLDGDTTIALFKPDPHV